MGQTLKDRLHTIAFRLERAAQARKELILLIIEAETQKLGERLQALSDEDLFKMARSYGPPDTAEPKKKVAPEPKKKVRKKPETVTEESRKNAAAGRDEVSRGKRPPLKTAIAIVMGQNVMNTAGVLKALEAKNWLPSSGNQHQYVSYMLSSNCPEAFERTERRGYYRVRAGYKFDTFWFKRYGDKKPRPKTVKAVTEDDLVGEVPNVDEALKDAFGGEAVDTGNPFGDLKDFGNPRVDEDPFANVRFEPEPKRRSRWGTKIMQVIKNREWTTVRAEHLASVLNVRGSALTSSLGNLVRTGDLRAEVVDGKTIYHVVT